MKRIKIVQIGIGHNHASEKMVALRQLSDVFDVVGVVETDPKWRETRGNWAAYDGLKWMSEEEAFAIADLDAVAVETDGFELVPTAIRCANRNLHIHMDKPGGECFKDFENLLNICQERALAFQQAYIYRYNPAINFCLDAVKKGWLGDVFEIHAVMSRYDGDNDNYRKWLSKFKGGAFYIFAGYLIDLTITLLGKPQKVSSFLQQTRNDGLIDNGLAVLEYERATATARVSVAEVDGMRHRRLIICGTKGSVELMPLEYPASEYHTRSQHVRLTLKDAQDKFSAGTQMVDCGALGSRYARQLNEFAQIIRGKVENPYSYEHEKLIHKILLNACNIKEI